MLIIDVSDPAYPKAVGGNPGYAEDVAIAGHFAYTVGLYGGLRIIDVRDPTSPSEVGTYTTPGSVEGVAAAGDYTYMADGDGGMLILLVAKKPICFPLMRKNQ